MYLLVPLNGLGIVCIQVHEAKNLLTVCLLSCYTTHFRKESGQVTVQIAHESVFRVIMLHHYMSFKTRHGRENYF